MGDFFVEPGVAGDDGDAEDFGFRRLDEQQSCLLVSATGTGFVLVNDDLLFFLWPEGDASKGYECYRKPQSAQFRNCPHKFSSRWRIVRRDLLNLFCS